ncbi:MAG: dynamin family protein [Acidithiobacillus sp.]|uniref:dynamin family protein n=1 Tax=Acidithiobacillus sp. TaxID=1872118 RepID=UPI003D00816A
METSLLVQRLQEFHQWRVQLASGLRELSAVTGKLELLPGATMLRLESLGDEIAQDSLRIAFFGEFARGKTELVNALFFADLGGRVLPSGPGQTTMCPVEISGCKQDPGLRLLPINSRSLDTSVEKLKRVKAVWTHLPLDLADVEARDSALAHITETLCVPLVEARRYGLCPPLRSAAGNQNASHCPSCDMGRVLIPRWRYALLSMPHPVLAAGLSILDTPGLNAIGSEPELALESSTSADAIVFVLGADTGVTQSDLEIWDQYLCRNLYQKQLVVLNKVDMLWDELRDDAQVSASIQSQVEVTARRLQISPLQVLPVSGQKGLVSRIRGDQILLARSGIAPLEAAIADILIPAKRLAVLSRVQNLVDRVVAEQRTILDEQIHHLDEDIDSMQRLGAQSEGKVPRLVARQQKILRTFASDRSAFHQKQREFVAATENWLLSSLSMDRFDSIIGDARNELLAAWTTIGIYERFSQFFADTISHFDTALDRANRLSALMVDSYRQLEQRYGLPALDTVPYAILPRRAELLGMAENYQRFGKRLEIAAKTQGAVVRTAFLTVATKVQDFVRETRLELQAWVSESLEMMNRQMDLFYLQAKDQLQALEAIMESMMNIQPRIAELERQKKAKILLLLDLDAAYQSLQGVLGPYTLADTTNNLA